MITDQFRYTNEDLRKSERRCLEEDKHCHREMITLLKNTNGVIGERETSDQFRDTYERRSKKERRCLEEDRHCQREMKAPDKYEGCNRGEKERERMSRGRQALPKREER